MKVLKFWAIALTLCVSLLATAEIRTIAEAYEVTLSDFRMPATENGVLSFKPCTDCDMQSVRVTSHTVYVVNQENIEITDFRKLLATVRDRSAVTVTVRHHLESDTIDWVSVTLDVTR